MNRRQRKKLEAKMKFNLPNVPHFTANERWDLFHTFSVYIAAGLKVFLSYKIFGVPTAISEKYHEDKIDENFKADKKIYEELQEEVNEIMREMDKMPKFDSQGEISLEMKEWRGILLKMLWTFEQIRDDYPESPFGKWHEKKFYSLLEQGIEPMEVEEPDECGLCKVKFNGEETPQEIWDAEEKYREKIQDGINLFAKYFLSLWD